MSITKALSKIQQELKAPKGQYNDFSKYNYRNCEDILEALKPLLGEHTVIVSDDIQLVSDRVYVKATAIFSDGKETVTVTAFAREALVKKGMDESQITGAASSYARKYALNGLFLIDDNKDADSHDNSPSVGGFVIDEIAQSWIDAAKIDPVALEEITDPAYKAFIEKEAKK